jgi:hypothetical protein
MLTGTHPNRALGMRLSEVPKLQKVIPSRKRTHTTHRRVGSEIEVPELQNVIPSRKERIQRIDGWEVKSGSEVTLTCICGKVRHHDTDMHV